MRLNEALWQDDERMSGTVCFRGTRVPVGILFEHLAAGRMDEFYEGYPNVTEAQVHAVVEASKELIEGAFRVAVLACDSRRLSLNKAHRQREEQRRHLHTIPALKIAPVGSPAATHFASVSARVDPLTPQGSGSS